MANGFRKAMVLLLCLTMVVSNLGMVNVRAESSEATMKEAIPGTSKVEGYANLTKEGEINGELLNSSLKKINEGKEDEIVIKKDITKNGDFGYDIELSVMTKEEVKTEDVAVVILVDASNSMTEKEKDPGYINTKKAAKELIKNLSEKTTGNCFVSIAKFGTYAESQTDWLDIKAEKGRQAADKAIDSLSTYDGDYGGTNMDAGFSLAKEKLRKKASISNQDVVMLSDGKPTFYLNKKGYVLGDGDKCSKETYEKTVASAQDLKEQTPCTLLTVYLGNVSEVCYTDSETIKHTECKHCGKEESDHIDTGGKKYCSDKMKKASAYKKENFCIDKTFFVC